MKGPLQAPRRRHMYWVIGGYDWSFICQFYNLQKRGVGYIGPVWLINSAWAGEAKASKASIETKIFSGFWGIPCWETRFSAWLVRDFICPQVGRSSGRWHQRRCFLKIFRAAMTFIGIFFSPGVLFFRLYFEHWKLPWGRSSDEEADLVRWIHLKKYKNTPSPVRLISQISIP